MYEVEAVVKRGEVLIGEGSLNGSDVAYLPVIHEKRKWEGLRF